ncbi:LOW QUALITY PROTEIN: hypothetical protein BRARA_A03090 [Brassica rapa]|uniref:Dilute domain-containing protein n=1 Tax=Brassica campestris TaxID=3711 RepID=A0A398AUE1_BRACM|nr:LOW QUALITY PROTEIN: hypothetical protein BRARA_A03090 [Brassica rapa]
MSVSLTRPSHGSDTHSSPFLVRKVLTQIFSFINVQLFNRFFQGSLASKIPLFSKHVQYSTNQMFPLQQSFVGRECCSFSNGEYVKAVLYELEHWCFKATDEYAGSSWDELKHIRQAIGFLVIHQKPKKTLDEISHDLCPVLSIQQLICWCHRRNKTRKVNRATQLSRIPRKSNPFRSNTVAVMPARPANKRAVKSVPNPAPQ